MIHPVQHADRASAWLIAVAASVAPEAERGNHRYQYDSVVEPSVVTPDVGAHLTGLRSKETQLKDGFAESGGLTMFDDAGHGFLRTPDEPDGEKLGESSP